MKTCRRCDITKPSTEFYKTNGNTCAECVKDMKRKEYHSGIKLSRLMARIRYAIDPRVEARIVKMYIAKRYGDMTGQQKLFDEQCGNN